MANPFPESPLKLRCPQRDEGVLHDTVHTDGIGLRSPVKRTIARTPSAELAFPMEDHPTARTAALPQPKLVRAEGPIIQEAWRAAEEMSMEQAHSELSIPFAHPASNWQNSCNKAGIRKDALNDHFKKSGLIVSPTYAIQGDIEVWIKAKPAQHDWKSGIRTAVVISDDNVLGLPKIRESFYSRVAVTCSLTVAHFARTSRVFSLYTNSNLEYPAGDCIYLGEFMFVHQAEFSKGVVGGDWYSLDNEERARMNVLGALNFQWSQTNNHAFDPDQIQVYILQWISFDCVKKAVFLTAVDITSPQDRKVINAVRVWEKRRKDYLAEIQQRRKIRMDKDKLKRSQAVMQALGKLVHNAKAA